MRRTQTDEKQNDKLLFFWLIMSFDTRSIRTEAEQKEIEDQRMRLNVLLKTTTDSAHIGEGESDINESYHGIGAGTLGDEAIAFEKWRNQSTNEMNGF